MSAPLRMWAVAFKGQRGEWINQFTIRSTRRQAIEAYDEMWTHEHHRYAARRRCGEVRAIRVTVTPETQEQG